MSYTTGIELYERKSWRQKATLKEALDKEYFVMPQIKYPDKNKCYGGILRLPVCLVGRIIKIKVINEKDKSEKQ